MNYFNFFGINIADANPDIAYDFINNYQFKKPAYISFPDLYVVTLCEKNEHLKKILNNALLTLPDGKPSAFFGRQAGLKNIAPVSGYWLCMRLLQTSLSHMFLGSTKENLQKIESRIRKDFPHANIKGFLAPKFVSELEARDSSVFSEEFEYINLIKPDLIWIGISSPKQDYIMFNHLSLLNQGLMLGVGGVFDYISGDVKKSPEIIKKIGLRWLWRLCSEPIRLGPKYYHAASKFVRLYINSKIMG